MQNCTFEQYQKNATKTMWNTGRGPLQNSQVFRKWYLGEVRHHKDEEYS